MQLQTRKRYRVLILYSVPQSPFNESMYSSRLDWMSWLHDLPLVKQNMAGWGRVLLWIITRPSR